MKRILLTYSILLLSVVSIYAQCPTIVVDAADLCPGGSPVTVTIDISEDLIDCIDAAQNSYAETMIFDFSGAGFEFVPGSEILNSGIGDINDGGAPFISSINASQIIIGGLGTNNGGGGRNAFDQITLSVDVITTAIVPPAFIRRNGGSFLINGGAEPFNTVPLVNLTSSQMVYNSTNVTQNTLNVSQNTTNAQVIGFEVDVTDDGCPLTIESIDLQYSGTSLADISNAKVFYSGTIPIFDPNSDILFGSINSPPAAFSINGSQELQDGTNYFWVAVDVPFTATAANQIDFDLIQYQYDDNGTPTTRVGGVDFPVGVGGARTITAFSGTVFTVGNSRMFTTLQGAYNNVPNNMPNNYIIELYNDYNDGLETFPVVFAQKTAYNGNIILIRPAAGQSGIRVGGNPGASNPLINFNSGDYVTIDGRPNSTGTNRELRFVNFNSGASAFSVFTFANGATNNKLDYLQIEGEAETSLTGLIDFEFAGGGDGNSNNVISNNYLTDVVGGTAKSPGVGVYSLGSAGTPNSNNTIENNQFVDIWDGTNFDSWCIQLSTGTDNWNIYGNHFYQTADYTSCDFNSGFIQIGDGGDYDISGNYFGGQDINAGVSTNPFTITSGLAPFDAIYFLATSGGGDNRFVGNTFTNFHYTSQTTLTFPALTILYNEGSSDFIIGSADGPNYFGDQSTTGAITLTNNAGSGSTGISGITNNGTGHFDIAHNLFGSIRVNGTRAGANTILIDNLSGSTSVDQCVFGGTNASSILVSSDSRIELVSNTAVSGLDISNSTFRNIDHNAGTEPFYCIYNLDGLLNADNNTFANISSDANVETRIINHIANGATITNNDFESIFSNSTGNAGALAMIYVNGGAFDCTITDNNLGGTVPGNIYVAGNDISYGIYKSGTGNLICSRNTVQGLEMDNSGANVRFYGIYSIGGDLTASENVIQEHTVNSTSTLTAFYGIYCSASGNNHLIADNTIENCSVDNGTTPISTSIEGIYISGNISTAERNIVRGLNNSGAAQSAEIIGINNAFGGIVIKNNVVILDNSGTLNSVSIKGIIDNDGGATVRVVHNVVSIGGNSVGTSSSTAYLRNADGNDFVTNNIFQNNRTGATGPDYCMEGLFTGGTFSSDNNFFENIDNSQMFAWGGGPEDLPTFQGSSTSNLASIVGNEVIDADGRTTAGFVMADGGADLFTPSIVLVDKDLNPRDVNPWPGAYEGVAVTLGPNYYVNDGLTAADEYCTAAGVDGAGCGTTTNPCATVQYVHDNYALNGDTIFVDDGSYSEIDITISQSLVVQGASTSPLFFGGGVLDNIRAFDITVPDVVLNRFRITGYRAYNKAVATDRNGAAIRILNVTGTTTLSNLLVDQCFAEMGGAISIEQNVPGVSDVKLSGSTLSLDSATVSGGAISAILVANGGLDLDITGCNIGNTGLRNGAQLNGGGIYFNGSNLNISNSLLTENNAFGVGATNGGGAIYVESGNVLLDTCFLLVNTAEKGGAIYVNNGSVTIDSAVLNANSANNNGGAIFMDNTSNVSIDRANFGVAAFPNIATNGGAIYVDGGVLDLYGTTFLNNSAVSNGGAINVRSECNISGCGFSSNLANNGAGILGDIGSRISLVGTGFVLNNATNNGGAIYSNLNSDISIDTCVFGFSAIGNTANNGGAIYFVGDSLEINNSTCSYNQAGDQGGNVFLSNSKLFANNSDFYSSIAGNKGGSFHISGTGYAVLDGCVVDSNSSTIGGAINIEGDSIIITNSQLNNNISQDEGAVGYLDLDSYVSIEKTDINFNSNIGNSKEGGGFFINDNLSQLDINQSTISGNQGDDRGIITTYGNLNITNSLIYENTVEKEGVITSYDNSILNLMNVTFTDNISNTGNAGIELRNNSIAQITNSIFWNNTLLDLNEQGGGAVLDVNNSIYGTSNITNGTVVSSYNSDPLFTNAAGDDYTITALSPGVDNGTLVGAPGVDIVDTIRPKGTGIDIGAYESDFAGCDTATVASLHTWTGATSNDWFDCTNWDTGTLPNSNCDVVIPGGTPFNPLVTAQTGYCRTIQINVPGGALLTLDTPGLGRLEVGP